MTRVLIFLTALLGAAFTLAPSAFAAEEGGTVHYPLLKPKNLDWSFGGPLGHWDIGQLQRGLKVYTEVCSACHSMKLLSYRNLGDLGFSEQQVKNYAAGFEVTDGPNEDGEMFQRAAMPTDRFKGPYDNNRQAQAANNGALPPDLSLIAKARAVERGFPTFLFDIFTMYAENGPDYIYSLLTGYVEKPAELELREGLHYNPYFISGPALAMAKPISDGQVSYDDGAPETSEQYSRDISAFLMWASEPELDARKQRGFVILIFLVLFSVLLYFTKKRVWADVPH